MMQVSYQLPQILLDPRLWYTLVGASFAAIASWSIQWYRTAHRRYAVRKSLRGEIESSSERLHEIRDTYSADIGSPIRSSIDTDVSRRMYDQHLSELGLLTYEEIRYATEYYRHLETLVQAQERYNELQEIERSEDQQLTSQSHLSMVFSDFSVWEASRNAIEAEEELLPRLKENTGRFWWFPF